ncbi:MAG: cytochrome c, partial [Rhodospirillaceae bacterium]
MSKRQKSVISAVVLGTCVLLAGLSAASGQILDSSVIDYRKQVMKAKDAQAQAIGWILTGTVPPDNIAGHFESLLLATRQARKAFEPEVPGGRARPEIWENWDDFSGRLDGI